VAQHGPENTGLAVSADPPRLQLVLSHLLGNAIKFTPPGGEVRVASRRQGDEVRVSVTDTGTGLTHQQMDGLWKPFAQAHDKSQRTDSGSGLGLYVAKGIVELHGGEVGCSSPGPGQGSTFWFTLPLATGHVDPLAKAQAPEEPVEAEPRRNLNPNV
jgi:signal transduction histidine kinase